MKDAAKIALLLIGGALILFRDQLRFWWTGKTTEPEPPAPTPASAEPAGPDIKALVAAAAARANRPTLQTFDEWNWFYSQVRGVPGPAIEDVFPGRDRGYRMAIDEWWAGVSQHGLSGLAWPWRFAGR